MSRETNLEWYLISVEKLRKIGVVVLLMLIGGAAWLWWDHRTSDPRRNAERAIADANSALDELASSKEFNKYRSQFERAQEKLTAARAHLAASEFPAAESAAIESQTITRAALAQLPGEGDYDAQFLSVEGDVQFQKAPSTEWKRAEARTTLINGDWVRTGNRGSAELIFANGSLYTVGPEALLEVYSAFNPRTNHRENSIQMQVGSIEINTTDDLSTIQTPSTRIIVEKDSSAQVGVEEDDTTRVFAMRGTSSVVPKAGGQAITLSSGSAIEATPTGELGAVRNFVMPPALVSPADNQVFRATSETNIQLNWNTQPKATAYRLQVSRSRLFSNLEIDAVRSDTRATVRITEEGNFYWRVASIDQNGDLGPFSTFRRFRVSGLGSAPSPAIQADKTPPELDLKRPFKIGGQFYMIEGKVEPGATLFINDEEIQVEADGSFKKLVSFDKVGWNRVVVKAVDAAGNQNVKTENVHVEE